MRALRITSLLLSLIGFFLVSCDGLTEAVELPEEDAKPRLVVNAVAQSDTLLVVQISKSRGTFEDKPFEFLDDAEVSIATNGVSKVLPKQLLGRYADSSFKLVPGLRYDVNVKRSGLDDAKGSISIPKHKLELISVDAKEVTIQDRRLLEVRISFEESSSSVQYYEARAVTKIEGDTVRGTHKWYSSFYSNSVYTDDFEDSDLEESGLNYFSQRALFTNEVFGKGKSSLTLYAPFAFGGLEPDEFKYYIEINSISESYYLYLNTLRAYSSVKDDPFAQPVQVHSNVEGGFGILGGVLKNEIEILWARNQ